MFLGIMEEKNVVDMNDLHKELSLKPQYYSTANNQVADTVEKERACNGVINCRMEWRLFVHRNQIQLKVSSILPQVVSSQGHQKGNGRKAVASSHGLLSPITSAVTVNPLSIAQFNSRW
ncbi:hypothetical protein OIU79_018313 [Salix purpurea]|uniref:Uncharacterized protein n=1 Tax=Salix purpurea TaxID=77065 RepID=A0A9Q0WXY4_SALPP|nr:hypothetical protein OIU79_018313 [Salix purpurea]